mmetsp:Transcript_25724/g.35682  ORF Transcript_25724/g.35682 Transcript_25724/m.35682 type:complete len:440 (+) Transcript_25724:367-1686(+)|eukprot:CAMPEP_0201489528 /NCGR_PEP_ID=MMETSP0151_2-20130828/22856_1 /ASSEMBLY_ACC=CAM_ASM_000257 /TAXON_ID=200890 /ORGANISM="Paramoeba atlantica, Strain 621/1 / CCAP 1560/9" /LENGTH=439 /DNA_ID=CAMNT_0047875149 /DNA_START=45 /DNA_END=1364 /DNA_ORIENTATION=+
MDEFISTRDIPEWVEGEPELEKLTTKKFVLHLLKRLVQFVLFHLVFFWTWIPFLLLLPFYDWPPLSPRFSQYFRHISRQLTEKANPPIPLSYRVVFIVDTTWKMSQVSVWGCCWFLDEILYGREMDKLKLQPVLFEISAARSGSTQLARYLEMDPSLAGVPVAHEFFPFLWFWRILPYTLGLFITKQSVEERLMKSFPPQVMERHEMKLFGADTFEIMFFGHHLCDEAWHMGPKFNSEEFENPSPVGQNKYLWEVDFVNFMERLGRKYIINIEDPSKRLFFKGHFLSSADALAQRFPDADFFTMVRPPDRVIQSFINFVHSFPHDPLGVPNFQWQVESQCYNTVNYLEKEMEWYTKKDGVKKTVIRFNDYIKNLEGTLQYLYKQCLDGKEIPEDVPRVHTERRRGNYMINRSLKDLGVNEEQVRVRLAQYYEWTKPVFE